MKEYFYCRCSFNCYTNHKSNGVPDSTCHLRGCGRPLWSALPCGLLLAANNMPSLKGVARIAFVQQGLGEALLKLNVVFSLLSNTQNICLTIPKNKQQIVRVLKR
jgi:hypothetical protein